MLTLEKPAEVNFSFQRRYTLEEFGRCLTLMTEHTTTSSEDIFTWFRGLMRLTAISFGE